MPTTRQTTYDVIIAGAGPVGLFLACELRLAGCSVLVLEQEGDPHAPLKRLPFGLRGLSVATQDALDRRDLLDAVLGHAVGRAAPEAAHWAQQPRRPAGHFAGIQFFEDKVDVTRWPWRVGAPAGSVAVAMESLEAVLSTRAQALGAVIRRGCTFQHVELADRGVSVRTSGGMFEAAWLVGCDGARSTVRRSVEIGFAGTEPEFTGYSALVELARPEELPPGRHFTPHGMYMFNAPGMVAIADFDGGAFHRTEPVTREHVEAVLRRISGVDVSVVELKLATTWTDRAFQAATYRRGRVLLAGDAAHIHAPLGGQGLNLGLGDAMNLGWKLAAAVRGDAPGDLLDTYESERRPVGQQVLDWSRAQVALMRPGPGARALEAIVRDLAETRDGATYFAERVWGVGLRYEVGCAHPLAGRSAPDLALAGGARLNARLRAGRGLLLVLEESGPEATDLAPAGARVEVIEARAEDRPAVGALLVRPDGIVAWACDAQGDRSGLAAAARRWFG